MLLDCLPIVSTDRPDPWLPIRRYGQMGNRQIGKINKLMTIQEKEELTRHLN